MFSKIAATACYNVHLGCCLVVTTMILSNGMKVITCKPLACCESMDPFQLVIVLSLLWAHKNVNVNMGCHEDSPRYWRHAFLGIAILLLVTMPCAYLANDRMTSHRVIMFILRSISFSCRKAEKWLACLWNCKEATEVRCIHNTCLCICRFPSHAVASDTKRQLLALYQLLHAVHPILQQNYTGHLALEFFSDQSSRLV